MNKCHHKEKSKASILTDKFFPFLLLTFLFYLTIFPMSVFFSFFVFLFSRSSFVVSIQSKGISKPFQIHSLAACLGSSIQSWGTNLKQGHFQDAYRPHGLTTSSSSSQGRRWQLYSKDDWTPAPIFKGAPNLVLGFNMWCFCVLNKWLTQKNPLHTILQPSLQ